MLYTNSITLLRNVRSSGIYALSLFTLLLPILSYADTNIEKADPSLYPSQDISTAFPGVTLSAFRHDLQIPPVVDPAIGSYQLVSDNVFSMLFEGNYVYAAKVEIENGNITTTAKWATTINTLKQGPDRNFRAEFTTPVSYVYMEVSTDNGDAYYVDVYNEQDKLLDSYSIPAGIPGANLYPIKFSRPTADIKYLIAQNPEKYYGRTVSLNNLQFSIAAVPKDQDPNHDPYIVTPVGPDPTPTPNSNPMCEGESTTAVPPVLKLVKSLDTFAGTPVSFSAYACGGNGLAIVVPPKPLPTGITPKNAKPATWVYDATLKEYRANFNWTPTAKQANKRYKLAFKAKVNVRNGKSSKPQTLQIRVWPANNNSTNKGVLKSKVTNAAWDAKKGKLSISGNLQLSSLLTKAERSALLVNTNIVNITNENTFSLMDLQISKKGSWTYKGTWAGVVPCQISADFLGIKSTMHKVTGCAKKS